jgi:predicted nucleic acid-binding protein
VVRDVTLVNPEPQHYLAAVTMLATYEDQPLTLADAVLAVLSRDLALPVWTFDHHFDVMRAAVWR